MEFIKMEDFLGQSKEIQKVFMDWWKPSTGDLLFESEREDIFMNELDNVIAINTVDEECNPYFKYMSKSVVIPLFTEGQLRQFIEDKTVCKVTLLQSASLPVEIWLYSDKNTKRISSINQFNVLQSYWKVATEIAKGESLNEN